VNGFRRRGGSLWSVASTSQGKDDDPGQCRREDDQGQRNEKASAPRARALLPLLFFTIELYLGGGEFLFGARLSSRANL